MSCIQTSAWLSSSWMPVNRITTSRRLIRMWSLRKRRWWVFDRGANRLLRAMWFGIARIVGSRPGRNIWRGRESSRAARSCIRSHMSVLRTF